MISSLSSTNTLFTFSPGNVTIAPGDSSKFYVTFAPIADSLGSGKIIFNHNAVKPKDTVNVSGTVYPIKIKYTKMA
jgi:hypothetical protein